MKVPDWMKLPLAALKLDPYNVERVYKTNIYLDWNHSLPLRSQQGAAHTVEILEQLFAANMLNLDLSEAPVEEGDQLLVLGIPLTVKYVQDKRIVLELPPGRRFRRRYDPRPLSNKEKPHDLSK